VMPSPVRRIERVHPSVSFTLLQSAAVLLLSGASRRLTPSLGLRSLCASLAGRVLRRNPNSDAQHPQRFARSRRLRCLPCGFISPHSRVQGSLYRVLPPAQRFRLVGVPCPLVVSNQALQPCGCATLDCPALRAFFRAGVQATAVGVSHDFTQSPHELLLLQVFSFDALIPLSQDLPLVGLLSAVRPISLPFSVQAPSLACLFRGCRPAQGF